jgi:RNA-directed DNA polymerase
MTVAITRHVKVPGTANPFDPTWAEYLARRRASKRSVKLFGAKLWY